MVGRNDPCPCGSGKKYKRCCGQAGTDLVGLLVNEELDQILSTFFDRYPAGAEREEMIRLMREWLLRLSDSYGKEDIEEAASEFYLFIKNPRSWHTYIAEQRHAAKREAVKQVLRAWDKPFLLIAEITGTDDGMLRLRQLYSDEEYHMTRNEGMPTDEGTLLFGTVLPDPRKREDAIAPISSMLFLAKWSRQTKESLIKLRKAHADKETDRFLQEHALDIYELMIKRSMASLNELVEEVLTASQLSGLQSLESALRSAGQDAEVREIMHKLSVAYFMNEQKELPSVADFTAGAVWTGSDIGIIRDLQKDGQQIADMYEADLEQMKRYKEDLTGLYKEMMNSFDDPMAARVYEIGTDPRSSEKGLWETAMTTAGVVQPERKLNINEGRAQRLAYEAYAAGSEEERRDLAERALSIAPELPDALLLQAENEMDPKVAGELYERAIRNGSRLFEPGETPWQNLPNRPFMRAAFAYGVHLFMQRDFDSAADVFKDLVRMNSTDNQGARYEAVASLIHAERYTEAAEILVRYEKGSQADAAYLYLDWKLEHEASEGRSEEAHAMLEKASKANGNVRHLMTFKAKTIGYPKQLTIQPGSDEEARYIWLLLNGPN